MNTTTILNTAAGSHGCLMPLRRCPLIQRKRARGIAIALQLALAEIQFTMTGNRDIESEVVSYCRQSCKRYLNCNSIVRDRVQYDVSGHNHIVYPELLIK